MTYDERKQETPPEHPASDYIQCDICQGDVLREDTILVDILIPYEEGQQSTKTRAIRICYECKYLMK